MPPRAAGSLPARLAPSVGSAVASSYAIVEERSHPLVRLAGVLVSSAVAAFFTAFLAAFIGSFLPDRAGAISFDVGLVIGAIAGAYGAWRRGPGWLLNLIPG